jgi:hypothetical protein
MLNLLNNNNKSGQPIIHAILQAAGDVKEQAG